MLICEMMNRQILRNEKCRTTFLHNLSVFNLLFLSLQLKLIKNILYMKKTLLAFSAALFVYSGFAQTFVKRGRIENVTDYSALLRESNNGARRIGTRSSAALPCTGSPKIPVVLVQFDDKKFVDYDKDGVVNKRYDDAFNLKEGNASPSKGLAAIRSFVRYGAVVDLRVVAVQADVEKIEFKKPAGKLVPYLTREELKVFLSQPNPATRTGFRDMAFLNLMYDTAARCQEMLDLKIGNLKLSDSRPVVYLTGKGQKTRSVPLMPDTAEHMRRYLKKFHPAKTRKGGDYVFYTQTSQL